MIDIELIQSYPMMFAAIVLFIISYSFKNRIGLILSLILAAVAYFSWRISETILPYTDIGISSYWMWVVLIVEFLSFIAGLIYIILNLKHYNRSKEADAYEAQLHNSGNYPSVDVFIPTYNEPDHVIKKAIFGSKNMNYPNFKVWVLDDGKRDWLKKFCGEIGVGYITRENNAHAKAGNMNNALAQTNGELIAIFDADFFAFPEFLNRTVGFFYDPKIGLVQTPHHFYNNDPLEFNSGLYKEVGDEQRLWFDDILEARDSYDLATSCGSSSVVRRSALDEIGGIFPTETITEDYDTSIRFLEKGYVTRYLNERLSVGLAAENLEGFFEQRRRWARGNIQVWKLHFKRKKFFNPLTYLMLFDWYYVVQIPSRLFISFIPLFFLYLGLVPLVVENLTVLALMHWVFLIISLSVLNTFSANKYVPFVTNAVGYVCAIKIFSTVVKTYIKPFGEPFNVTPKGISVYEASHESKILLTFLNIMIIALITGSVFALMFQGSEIYSTVAVYDKYSTVAVAVYWALVTAFSLLIAREFVKEKPRHRKEERFITDDTVMLYNSKTNKEESYSIENVSLGGMAIRSNVDDDYDYVRFKNGVQIPILEIHSHDDTNTTIYAFKEITPEQEEQLTVTLFDKSIIPERTSSLYSLMAAVRKVMA